MGPLTTTTPSLSHHSRFAILRPRQFVRPHSGAHNGIAARWMRLEALEPVMCLPECPVVVCSAAGEWSTVFLPPFMWGLNAPNSIGNPIMPQKKKQTLFAPSPPQLLPQVLESRTTRNPPLGQSASVPRLQSCRCCGLHA